MRIREALQLPEEVEDLHKRKRWPRDNSMKKLRKLVNAFEILKRKEWRTQNFLSL
jgi:hypothetical protein